ncbi:MAG: secondary thiamine-phosphate synthase enzyme YjbQ [Hyphomicrobium sp.]
MKQKLEYLSISTKGPGLIEITELINPILENSEITNGLLTIYSTHTSASLLIQENADPDVQFDIKAYFQRMVPEDERLYLHQSEGSDDMPAHIKSALTQTSLSIPISDKKMTVGQWQGIYLFEHRKAPHVRRLVVHIIGET